MANALLVSKGFTATLVVQMPQYSTVRLTPAASHRAIGAMSDHIESYSVNANAGGFYRHADKCHLCPQNFFCSGNEHIMSACAEHAVPGQRQELQTSEPRRLSGWLVPIQQQSLSCNPCPQNSLCVKGVKPSTLVQLARCKRHMSRRYVWYEWIDVSAL
eukprot:748750-Hanusia_phi.AAC.1